MPLSAAALKALLDAGVAPDAIVAAAEAEEAADRERARAALEAERADQAKKRLTNKINKRNQRERDKIATGQTSIAYAIGAQPAPPRDAVTSDIRNVSDVICDTPFPLPSPTPPTNPLPPFGGGGGDAREAEKISEHALALADQVMAIMGVDRVDTPVGWCGTAMFLHGGMREGWRPEVILLAVQEVAAGRRGKNRPLPYSFAYLTQPINRKHEEIAMQRSFAVQGVVSTQGARHGGSSSAHRSHQRGGVVAAGIEHLARLAEAGGLQGRSAEPGERVSGDNGGDVSGGELQGRGRRVG